MPEKSNKIKPPVGSEKTVSMVQTTWGDIRIGLSAGKIVECKLPFLSSKPRRVLTVIQDDDTPASRFVATLLKGRAPTQMRLGSLAGTAFQTTVWKAISSIPRGQTRSYSELAAAIGRPTAYRAVATACGKNPVPLFIPCHRVVAADGSLGGFSAGVPWKRQLLELER